MWYSAIFLKQIWNPPLKKIQKNIIESDSWTPGSPQFQSRWSKKRRQFDIWGGAAFLLSPGHYILVFIFAGVRRQTLASSQRALPLPLFSLSPWWMGGCSSYALIHYHLPHALALRISFAKRHSSKSVIWFMKLVIRSFVLILQEAEVKTD